MDWWSLRRLEERLEDRGHQIGLESTHGGWLLVERVRRRLLQSGSGGRQIGRRALARRAVAR